MQSPQEIEEAIKAEEQRREVIKKRVEELRAGISEKAEEDRQHLVDKLEELQTMFSGPPAEAIGRAIEAVAKIVDTPVLTREASEILLSSLEAWLAQASTDLSTFMLSIKDTLDAFIAKYSVELDAQIKARRKEEEVLDQLSRYLSRYI